MAEKLAQKLGPEPRKLKVGKSFEKQRNAGPGIYHGIRYDFKPVSIDDKRDGRLEVGENKSVAVSLPHVNGSGQTNYKGNLKPTNAKECVLIIDHNTGELTIERISNQILMKKTRAEKMLVDEPQAKPAEEVSNPYAVKKIPDNPNPYQVKKVPDNSNPYAVKKTPDNQYQVKKVPDNDPYAVKKIPDKPMHNRNSELRSRKGSQSKEYDSDFSITPMNSAKSSPASAKPSPSRQVPLGPGPLGQVDCLGRPLDSSSSSSSDSSDSDSDFEEQKPAAPAPVENPASMSSLFSQDFSAAVPAIIPQARGGGVLPTARPVHHKHKKSSGHDSTKSKPASTSHSKVDPPSKQSMSNLLGDANLLLGDDLMLSDSDNSD